MVSKTRFLSDQKHLVNIQIFEDVWVCQQERKFGSQAAQVPGRDAEMTRETETMEMDSTADEASAVGSLPQSKRKMDGDVDLWKKSSFSFDYINWLT